MSRLKIGQVNLSPAGTRDACHVPVVQVTSAAILIPGDRLVFVSQVCVRRALIAEPFHAIVDPFVEGAIVSGATFGAWLNPNMVDSFGHTFEIKGVDTKTSAAQPATATDPPPAMMTTTPMLPPAPPTARFDDPDNDDSDGCRYRGC